MNLPDWCDTKWMYENHVHMVVPYPENRIAYILPMTLGKWRINIGGKFFVDHGY